MILDAIIEKRKRRLAFEKKEDRYGVHSYLKGENSFGLKERSLIESIEASNGMGVVAEVKKASPSKGLICKDFNPFEIAKEYEKAGAAGISVLTEEEYFLGSREYLREVRKATKLPILRKDFIFDEYQIAEARVLGADGVLLICRLFSEERLRELKEYSDKIGLEVLLEVNNPLDVEKALGIKGELLGINNRDLSNFQVDLKRTEELIKLIPEGITVISESGITGKSEVEKLIHCGVKGILVGETLMKAVDKSKKMKELSLETSEKKRAIVKICGAKTLKDIEGINAAAPDYCGFVLAESKRRVEMSQLHGLIEKLDNKIVPVGVFVNPSHKNINSAVDCGIKIVQLHGEENQEFIDEVNARHKGQIEIWKAIRIKETGDLQETPKGIHAVLLDKYSDAAHGGTGERIEKNQLTRALDKLRQEELKIILAGGLTLENLEEVVGNLSVEGLDVSSGVETEGTKDWAKMKDFVERGRVLFKLWNDSRIHTSLNENHSGGAY